MFVVVGIIIFKVIGCVTYDDIGIIIFIVRGRMFVIVGIIIFIAIHDVMGRNSFILIWRLLKIMFGVTGFTMFIRINSILFSITGLRLPFTFCFLIDKRITQCFTSMRPVFNLMPDQLWNKLSSIKVIKFLQVYWISSQNISHAIMHRTKRVFTFA